MPKEGGQHTAIILSYLDGNNILGICCVLSFGHISSIFHYLKKIITGNRTYPLLFNGIGQVTGKKSC